MSARPHTVSPYRYALDEANALLAAAVTRTPSVPESSITIGTTAKRIHTWEITVRGEDIEECSRVAQRLDDALAAKFAHELDTDTLASDLARSVVKGTGTVNDK